MHFQIIEAYCQTGRRLDEIETDYSMVYISFDSAGKEFYYVDLLGAINEETFNEPIRTLKFVRTQVFMCIRLM